MRIPIFYNVINRKKYFLYIEPVYQSTNEIIPIGQDCHPAYVLRKLHLRKYSLPFDWLNNNPIKAIAYADDNLRNKFDDFMKGLKKNERGKVVAEKYPYCEFLHNPDLIESEEEKMKFKRRIERILKIVKNSAPYFLNNVSAYAFESERDVYEYVGGLRDFLKNHLHELGRAAVYVRFDDFICENDSLSKLFLELESLEKSFKGFKYVKYIRESNVDKAWGNPRSYPKLLRDLNIPLKKTGYKIYIKITRSALSK
uniref:DUF1796 family putative cysteine peptidase n=1 Tax=Ornithobacterium rhinotracheale TaxID=28251 RepID=UPI0039A49275